MLKNMPEALLFIFLVAGSLSCGPRIYTDENGNPIVYSHSKFPSIYEFYTCTNLQTRNVKSHALAAMFLALQEQEWNINYTGFKEHVLMAEKWLRQYVAKMEFIVKKDGTINAMSARTETIDDKLADDVFRWMNQLKGPYNKYACFSDEELLEKMKEYDFTY